MHAELRQGRTRTRGVDQPPPGLVKTPAGSDLQCTDRAGALMKPTSKNDVSPHPRNDPRSTPPLSSGAPPTWRDCSQNGMSRFGCVGATPTPSDRSKATPRVDATCNPKALTAGARTQLMAERPPHRVKVGTCARSASPPAWPTSTALGEDIWGQRWPPPRPHAARATTTIAPEAASERGTTSVGSPRPIWPSTKTLTRSCRVVSALAPNANSRGRCSGSGYTHDSLAHRVFLPNAGLDEGLVQSVHWAAPVPTL